VPKAATRSPGPGGGARRAGIPRVHARARRIVHLRTDNQPDDIRTSRRSPMATQHEADQSAGLSAECHKQCLSSVGLRCYVDLVSRTSERPSEQTNYRLRGSLPQPASSSHGYAPCLANAVWLYTPPTCAAYHSLSVSNALLPQHSAATTARLIAHETVPETQTWG
jgi:hypothetical protein